MLSLIRRRLVAFVMILLEKLSVLKQFVSLYIAPGTMPQIESAGVRTSGATQKKCKGIRWLPTSQEDLDKAEQKIFSYLRGPYKTYYVDIGPRFGLEQVQIWTLEAKHTFCENGLEIATTDLSSTANEPELLPLVLVHGFASGIALWSMNLDKLSLHGKRHVYAFDMLGFAKSSRPKYTFPKFRGMSAEEKKIEESKVMEEYLVDSMEKWRKTVGGPLNKKFILLGHSFGGYLSTAYMLRHPEHVARLILADPWGFPEDAQTPVRPENGKLTSIQQIPTWIRLTAHFFINVLHPLSIIRFFGPWGPKLFTNARADLKKRFQRLENDYYEVHGTLPNGEPIPEPTVDKNGVEKPYENNMIMEYIYHANTQMPPSGELSFKKMCTTAMPRRPMIQRVHELDPNLQIDFICGGSSWINSDSGYEVKKKILDLTGNDRVNVHIIPKASHHVYADDPDEFNRLVLNACKKADLTFHETVTRQLNEDIANGNVTIDQEDDNNNDKQDQPAIITKSLEINLARVES